MALGTNYKRTGDREDKRRENNLKKHFELMEKYIKEGLTGEEASNKAFKDIAGYSNSRVGCKK